MAYYVYEIVEKKTKHVFVGYHKGKPRHFGRWMVWAIKAAKQGNPALQANLRQWFNGKQPGYFVRHNLGLLKTKRQAESAKTRQINKYLGQLGWQLGRQIKNERL